MDVTLQIYSDEKNLKRAIKYVTKYNRNNSNEKYNYKNTEKSASPFRRRPIYEEYNLNTTPIRRVLNITREPLFRPIQKNYVHIMKNDFGNDLICNKINNINENNRNNTEDYYDIEISSINENGMHKEKMTEQIRNKIKKSISNI